MIRSYLSIKKCGFAQTLRKIRATPLSDTLPAWLDNDIDIGTEYRKHVLNTGEEARNG